MLTDCGDTGDCLLPMWFQYVIVAAAFLLFVLKAVWSARDERRR